MANYPKKNVKDLNNAQKKLNSDSSSSRHIRMLTGKYPNSFESASTTKRAKMKRNRDRSKGIPTKVKYFLVGLVAIIMILIIAF